jgi:hypothetical protein
MWALKEAIDTGSRSLSYLLGGIVAVLAVTVVGASMSVADLLISAQQIFGVTFIVLVTGLAYTAIYCLQKMRHEPGRTLWFEAGMQAAGGITTLALTYTLMGISLGIGSLAQQALTPDSVQGIIQELTGKFSMAFMTTVVGLPVAAVLRALLVVTQARSES